MADRNEDTEMGDSADDLFLGGKPIRTGYDSYSVYDPSTKKRTGRYISKTPAAAALKAANRLFKKGTKSVAKKGKKGGNGEADAPSMEGFGGAADCTSHYKELGSCMGVTGGAKSSADLFKKEVKTIKFMLRKTTRGAMSSGKRVFYYFAATLKTYKTPLVVMRKGQRVVIKNKVFVESLELPVEFKEMMEARKAKKTAAKKAAAKKAKVPKEKKVKAPKAPKAAKARKAPKAAKKATKAKKPKAPKMSGGGSCNMYY